MGKFQQQLEGNYVVHKIRFKRTTPFSDNCAFIVDTGWGELEPCASKADFGLYFGNDEMVGMISYCHFHTIYQESVWVAEGKMGE
jgi:hypothetical protein